MNLLPEFQNPHALWLVLLVPLHLLYRRWRVTTASVRYPSVRNLRRLPMSFRRRCLFLLPLLESIAVLLMVVVLARPVRETEIEDVPTEGIAIAMVLDKSGSMGDPENKLKYEKELAFRFDVAKDVFKKFVRGDGKELEGRPDDLIGLFTFGTYPQTDHIFTLDRASLVRKVERMSAEKPFLDSAGRPTDRQTRVGNPMSGTDLKKAVDYAADKLVLLGEDLERSSGGQRKYELRDRVIVLVTDGMPTMRTDRGRLTFPDEETIEKLQGANIRVYYIQILSRRRWRERPDGTIEVVVRPGDRQGEIEAAFIEEARRFTWRTNHPGHTGDVNSPAAREQVAREHFLVASGDQLKGVYEEIDRLEKSELSGHTVVSREECYQPYLTAALIVLAAQAALGLTWLRRAP